MKIEQTINITNILNDKNFYCNTETGVPTEQRGFVMELIKYGSALVGLAALGYGAFELVGAFVAWFIVAVPLFLTALAKGAVLGLEILGILFLGYWGFIFLLFMIEKALQDKESQPKAVEHREEEVFDVEILENNSEKKKLDSIKFNSLSDINIHF